jgi:hypothetical protein
MPQAIRSSRVRTRGTSGARARRRSFTTMDRTTHPPTGELLLTGALLSLYVGLRSSAWAVGRLERITAVRGATAR